MVQMRVIWKVDSTDDYLEYLTDSWTGIHLAAKKAGVMVDVSAI
jgi:hypothetical protein